MEVESDHMHVHMRLPEGSGDLICRFLWQSAAHSYSLVAAFQSANAEEVLSLENHKEYNEEAVIQADSWQASCISHGTAV